MKAVSLCCYSVFVLLACGGERFRWRTDGGRECDTHCDGGFCAWQSLKCAPSEAPGFNCSQFNRNDASFVPCWNAGPVSIATLLPDADSGVWGICQECCCENCNGGASWATPHCELLTCSPAETEPPLPLSCVQGQVVIPRRN